MLIKVKLMANVERTSVRYKYYATIIVTDSATNVVYKVMH